MSNHTKLKSDVMTSLGKGIRLVSLGVHGHKEQKSGWPDVYVSLPGGFHFWIEFKTGTGKLRPIQEKVITELTDNKVPVFVINDYDKDFKFVLPRLIGSRQVPTVCRMEDIRERLKEMLLNE